MPYSDNIEEVERWIESNTPTREHVLEEQNVMEYAEELHDRAGYYVFNKRHALDTVRKWLKKVVDAGMPLGDKNIKNALDAAGHEDIDFLRSYLLQGWRPPAVKGEGKRRRHPGKWADIKGHLKNAFRHRVDRSPWTKHEDND